MATIAIPVQQNTALAGIDTVKVDTSARCRARTRAAASQGIVAEAMRIEEAEAVETQDVVIIRITAVAAMQEVAPEQMIAAAVVVVVVVVAVVVAEEAKVEAEGIEMVLPDTRA
jgi:hypothetical protein